MPEYHPEHDPGHLDIDAVSAFVDRDFEPVELAAIDVHLRQCQACDREVLEIHATVLLMSGLPQYEPRRSFCLGQEHARASRRGSLGHPPTPWAPSPLAPGQVGGQAAALPMPGASGGGWLPGLQVAALVVGALLLLVTAGDLTGFVPGDVDPLQLAAPTALAETPVPPMAAMPAPEMAQPGAERGEDALIARESMPANFDAELPPAPADAGGTESGLSASDEVPAAARAPAATSAALAAVTQAIPTQGAAPASDGTADTAASSERSGSDGQPSRIRIVQLALALLLAWIVVSIAGLRWVRRLR